MNFQNLFFKIGSSIVLDVGQNFKPLDLEETPALLNL